MSALEIAFVCFLNIFTLFALAALAWVAILVPLREDVDKLKQKQQLANWQAMKAMPDLNAPRPNNVLPSIDDLPENIFDVGDFGNYGDVTPEEAEEEMSELQVAAKEANEAWVDLEDMRHGKRAPIIYSG